MASILSAVDNLEERVRGFIVANPEGGRFDLPELGMDFLAIPVMIGIFEEEGWSVFYDCDDNDHQWLEMEKAAPVLIGYEENGFVD